MTVAEVLGEARELHPAFNRKWTPDELVRRHLETYQQELFALLARRKRDALQSTWRVEIPEASAFSEGQYIPEAVFYHGGTVVFADGADAQDLELLDFPERNIVSRPYSAWINRDATVGITKIMLSGAVADWSNVDHVDLFYFPAGAELEDNTVEFTLPGQHRGPLVARAALFLARRAPKDSDPPVELREFRAESERAELLWLDQASGANLVDIGTVREVW